MLTAKGISDAAIAIRQATSTPGTRAQQPPDVWPALAGLAEACLAAMEHADGVAAERVEYREQQQQRREAEAKRQHLIRLKTTEKGLQRDVLIQEAHREVQANPDLMNRLRTQLGRHVSSRDLVMAHYPVVRDRWLAENRHKWDNEQLSLMLAEVISAPPQDDSVSGKISRKTRLSRKVFGGEKLTPVEAIDWEERERKRNDD